MQKFNFHVLTEFSIKDNALSIQEPFLPSYAANEVRKALDIWGVLIRWSVPDCSLAFQTNEGTKNNPSWTGYDLLAILNKSCVVLFVDKGVEIFPLGLFWMNETNVSWSKLHEKRPLDKEFTVLPDLVEFEKSIVEAKEAFLQAHKENVEKYKQLKDSLQNSTTV